MSIPLVEKKFDYQEACNSVFAQQICKQAEQIKLITNELFEIKGQMQSVCGIERTISGKRSHCYLILDDGSEWRLKNVLGINVFTMGWCCGDVLKIMRVSRGTWTTHAYKIFNATRGFPTFGDIVVKPKMDPGRYDRLIQM